MLANTVSAFENNPDGWPLTLDRIVMGNAIIEIGATDELRVLRTA